MQQWHHHHQHHQVHKPISVNKYCKDKTETLTVTRLYYACMYVLKKKKDASFHFSILSHCLLIATTYTSSNLGRHNNNRYRCKSNQMDIVLLPHHLTSPCSLSSLLGDDVAVAHETRITVATRRITIFSFMFNKKNKTRREGGTEVIREKKRCSEGRKE